jgi:hypothetical protein
MTADERKRRIVMARTHAHLLRLEQKGCRLVGGPHTAAIKKFWGLKGNRAAAIEQLAAIVKEACRD